MKWQDEGLFYGNPLYPGEPFLELGLGTANHFKKCFLYLFGDGASFALADHAVVHLADRRDLGGGSG